MTELHPINRTLLTALDNQVARTVAAFDGLDEATYVAEPGKDCNSIQRIGRHLLLLRQFQMKLLGSPLAGHVEFPEKHESIDELTRKLDRTTDLLRTSLTEQDPEDWYEVPPVDKPRQGRWGDEPTIQRCIRPFNDFTNHLGAVRVIRRILGRPAEGVQ